MVFPWMMMFAPAPVSPVEKNFIESTDMLLLSEKEPVFPILISDVVDRTKTLFETVNAPAPYQFVTPIASSVNKQSNTFQLRVLYVPRLMPAWVLWSK